MTKLSSFCFFLSIWGLLLFAGTALSTPAPTVHPGPGKRQEGKVPLRILPLGASITWGLASSDNNGYRKALRDRLRSDGFNVNMVGSRANGNMADNDVEGTSGHTIDQVRSAAANSKIYKPNVVLINAGTNDCARNLDIAAAGNRMRGLIMDLLSAPDMDNTLIVLSTLLRSGNPTTMANQPVVNDQYRGLVTELQSQGQKIVLADMDPALPYPSVFADDTHPNDEGYRIMASVWYDAIKEAESQGLISPAGEMDLGDGGTTCNKTPGNGVYAGGNTQRGSGEDDGIYYHSSEAQGVLFSFDSDDDNDLKVFFARLYRQDRDDILIWEKNNGVARYDTYVNTGAPSGSGFTRVGWTSVDDNCNETGAHFIDINGDGLDDFVCIGLDGTAFASINNGDGTFTYLGKWKDREGADQDRVRLGDVDGDGRADYCVLSDNGDIRCWRNGWIDDVPKYWQPLGTRFTGKNMGDLRGVRFEDLNGDGRDDWLWVDVDGRTTTWTNSRSCNRGVEGDGLNIVWRQGFQEGRSSGPTHPGMGSFASSGLRNRVHFARIIGQPQDFGLLGRQDYAFFDIQRKTGGGFKWDMHVWKNLGSGATKIKADSNRYCNMQGHDDGRMDYVWILSKGDMRIYPNKGLSEFSDSSESYWGPNSVIFDPAAIYGRDLNRRDLHLADWDGDGVCDIIWTDPDNANRMHVWRNRIKETGSYNWEYHFEATPYCTEKRGVGFFDRPVHLADITGNGMADYLCVEPDGRTWGFVHNDNGWEYMDQIKFAEDRDRANLQWADVNGDKRADLIHTNKFTGDATVWYNQGRRDIGGSRFHWVNQGVLYSGAAAGACTYFPDLDGDGRADMHAIIHSLDNKADSWYNKCGGKDNNGDDGPITPGNPDDCDTNERSWENIPTRPVDYWDPAGALIEHEGGAYGRQYINIVNLTPYKIRYLKDASHWYQMNEFDFGDIPPGRARQCVMHYSDGEGTSFPVDDKGEAYFEVENTPYKFAILARTNYGSDYNKRTIVDLSDWGMGVREFEQAGSQASVNLVITGSQSYGFYSTINLQTSGPVAWMNHIRDVLAPRQLKHVIMPGSHNSGMDRISVSWLGSASSTQNQGLNMYEQLKVGTRFFDMRVFRDVQVDDESKFWTAHVNDHMAGAIVGARGMSWDDVVSGLNSFTEDYPGEVVVIKLRYLVDLLELYAEDRYWDDEVIDMFYDQVRRVNNRCVNLKSEGNIKIGTILMRDLQSRNGGKGCVLFFNEGTYTEELSDRRQDYGSGIYDIHDLDINDVWSNMNQADEIAEHQLSEWRDNRQPGSSKDKFHNAQWLSTADYANPNTWPLQKYAIYRINGHIYNDAVMGMSPDSFPTVFMHDYVGVRLDDRFDEEDFGWEAKTLAMGLNLYLVSENCDIGKQRHPFYPLERQQRLLSSPSDSGTGHFNGIIFANGTTLQDVSSELKPWRETILRNGTVFANGTVLTQDVPMPDLW